jgi:hypothetical protein
MVLRPLSGLFEYPGRRGREYSEGAMPTIGRIGSLDVMIFRNDHDPPHFHVIGAEFSAKFTIADFALLSSKGRIRRRDLRDIEEWGQNHQTALHLNRRLARAGKPPQKIVD